MKVEHKIRKWGNSYIITIPPTFIKANGCGEGDIVEVKYNEKNPRKKEVKQ